MKKKIKKVIGDKSIFAIEYIIEQRTPYIMGRIRLWMNSFYVGSYEEEQMLLVVLNQLEILKKTGENRKNNESFVNLNTNEIYKKINNNNYNYLLSLGETFDDFLIYVYYFNNNFYFLWELLENPFFTYLNYPKGIQNSKIPKNTLFQVIEKFKNSII